MTPVPWAREVALAIVNAGVRMIVKRAHPDVGGSHEAMLTVTATADRLRAAIGAGLPTTVVPLPLPPGARRRRRRRTPVDAPPLAPWGDSGRWLCCGPVYVTAETDRALLIGFPDGTESWIPRSQIHAVATEVWERGDSGRIVISVWFATQKGWWS